MNDDSDLKESIGAFFLELSKLEDLLIHYAASYIYISINQTIDLRAQPTGVSGLMQCLTEDLADFFLADTPLKPKWDKYACLARASLSTKPDSIRLKYDRKFGQLQAKVLELSQFRNSVAHSRWEFMRPKTKSRMPRTSSGKFRVERDTINEQSLKEATKRTALVCIDLSKLHQELQEC